MNRSTRALDAVLRVAPLSSRRRAVAWMWLGNVLLGTLIGLSYLRDAPLHSSPRLWLFAHLGLVSAVATFMLAGPPNLIMLIAYTIVFTIGEAIWSSRFYEHVAALSPPGRIGVYMGIAGLPWFLAKTVTGLYAGAMTDAFVPEGGGGSPGTMWIIHGAIAMISPISLVLGRRWLLARPAS